jgi:hypothetical protein
MCKVIQCVTGKTHRTLTLPSSSYWCWSSNLRPVPSMSEKSHLWYNFSNSEGRDGIRWLSCVYQQLGNRYLGCVKSQRNDGTKLKTSTAVAWPVAELQNADIPQWLSMLHNQMLLKKHIFLIAIALSESLH